MNPLREVSEEAGRLIERAQSHRRAMESRTCDAREKIVYDILIMELLSVSRRLSEIVTKASA